MPLNHSLLAKTWGHESLDEYIKTRKLEAEDFRRFLNRLCAGHKTSIVDLYRKAGVDKSTISKISSSGRVSKETVWRLGFALKLSEEEMEKLLSVAGYVLTDYRKEDLIVKYCLENKLYDLSKINECFLKQTKKMLYQDSN
jgi:hypothetical protein